MATAWDGPASLIGAVRPGDTLLIGIEADADMPDSFAEQIKAALPGVTVIAIHGAVTFARYRPEPSE
jgi:hypothetical protein